MKELQKGNGILSGFVQKNTAKYPILISCIMMYLWLKPLGVMIAPDVFIRPCVVFLYLAIIVLPWRFSLVMLPVGMSLSSHPIQSLFVISISSQVCFFASRILLMWFTPKKTVSTAAVMITTFTAQLACTIFKSITGVMPFFTYLPIGMGKAATNMVGAVIIIPVALMVLEYFGIIDFRRGYEGLRFPRRISQLVGRLQTRFVSNHRK